MVVHEICAELLRAHDELMDQIAGVHPVEEMTTPNEMYQLADYFAKLDASAQAEFGQLANLVRELDRDAEHCRWMSQRWAKKAQARERAAEWYRDNIIRALLAIGGEITTPDGERLVVRANHPKVEVDELLHPANLPPDLVRTKLEVDKLACRKAIEAGRDVPGVHLIRKRSLRIV